MSMVRRAAGPEQRRPAEHRGAENTLKNILSLPYPS